MGKDKNKNKNKKAVKTERSVFALFFSPTGNTQKAVRAVAKGIADKIADGDYFAIDITAKDAREGVYDFGPSDVVIIGVPTYAGRVPNKIMPYFEEAVFGNGAIGISVVTYGNRAYDDALKEISHIMSTNEFNMLSAMAIPSEHAFVKELSTNRPNDDDINTLIETGCRIGNEIKKADNDGSTKLRTLNVSSLPGREVENMEYYVPKKENGEPAVFLKAKPVTDASKCQGCGECRNICPMGCYDNDILNADGVCIKCQGCISVCPNGAKSFDNDDFLSHIEYLKKNYADAKCEIEIFT